jgi:hypothetical protein
LSEGLSPAVERFLDSFADSAEQLQIMLLMRAEPTREWTAGELAAAAFSVPQSVQVRLERLRALGFAALASHDPPRFRWAVPDEETARTVNEVELAYRTNRVAVVNRIYARPADPLRSFADAFKLRRDP